MARSFRQGSVKITDKPTLIVTVPHTVNSVIVQNIGSAPVFIGGDDVTTDGELSGIRLGPKDPPLPIPCYEYDSSELYGISGGSGGVVSFLVSN